MESGKGVGAKIQMPEEIQGHKRGEDKSDTLSGTRDPRDKRWLGLDERQRWGEWVVIRDQSPCFYFCYPVPDGWAQLKNHGNIRQVPHGSEMMKGTEGSMEVRESTMSGQVCGFEGIERGSL